MRPAFGESTRRGLADDGTRNAVVGQGPRVAIEWRHRMSGQLRLIRGRDGWWALRGTRAARLPTQAVDCTPPGDPQWWDPVSERGLQDAAGTALTLAGFFENAPDPVYAVTVLTATSCNLGCSYCFQNTAPAAEGSFAPPRIPPVSLTPERARATAAFVAKQQAAHHKDKVTLLLFGGEPLLNLVGCTAMLEALAPLGLTAAEIVTNGVLLTPVVAARLRDAGLSRAQISFDGHRPHHDAVRVTRGGRATYDTILENVTRATDTVPDLAWNFRVNVSHRNLDGLPELIADLSDIPLRASDVTLHLALIDDTGLGYNNDLGYDHRLAAAFAGLNRQAIAASMRVPFSQPLTACPYCSLPGGAGGAVVNADGALYSCWENAGRTEWQVGNVADGYEATDTVLSRWVACDFDTKSHGTGEATRRFFDHLDAAALDDQYEFAAMLPARVAR